MEMVVYELGLIYISKYGHAFLRFWHLHMAQKHVLLDHLVLHINNLEDSSKSLFECTLLQEHILLFIHSALFVLFLYFSLIVSLIFLIPWISGPDMIRVQLAPW